MGARGGACGSWYELNGGDFDGFCMGFPVWLRFRFMVFESVFGAQFGDGFFGVPWHRSAVECEFRFGFMARFVFEVRIEYVFCFEGCCSTTKGRVSAVNRLLFFIAAPTPLLRA